MHFINHVLKQEYQKLFSVETIFHQSFCYVHPRFNHILITAEFYSHVLLMMLSMDYEIITINSESFVHNVSQLQLIDQQIITNPRLVRI